LNEEIQKLVKELNSWRKSKKDAPNVTDQARRIPEEFWQRAYALHVKYPKSNVKSKCMFNYYDWLKRFPSHKNRKTSPTTPPLKLIEVPSLVCKSESEQPRLSSIGVSTERKDQLRNLNRNTYDAAECQMEVRFDSGFTVRIWR
jgi:hypothetical protein